MRKLAFYVGIEYDKDGNKLSEQQVNDSIKRITHLVASLCGGWTAIKATGGSLQWESKEDTVIIETVYSPVPDYPAEDVIKIVAEAAKAHFIQDSVMVTDVQAGVDFI